MCSNTLKNYSIPLNAVSLFSCNLHIFNSIMNGPIMTQGQCNINCQSIMVEIVLFGVQKLTRKGQ